MATKKKMLQAAAGVGGEALNVEDVFSTYLWYGNNSARAITNGIDLDGEGGLVWIKKRLGSPASSSKLFDTERGVNKYIQTTTTAAELTVSNLLTGFNSNGFDLGADSGNYGINYDNGDDAYASWTFRKAPKFFDVVTYTGTGSVRTVNHNLGSAPGFIIIKETSGTAGWYCYHRSLTATDTIVLNETGAASDSIQYWNNTEPTDSVFTVGAFSEANDNGQTYVAYLFAHNDGDGDFGPDGDADIIKCGSYTGDGSSDHSIDLGFPAQWVMIKNSGGSYDWVMYDAMRGLPHDQTGEYLAANSTAVGSTSKRIGADPSGFSLVSNDMAVNGNGQSYIYMAIGRGTKVPEDADEVFAIDTRTTTADAAAATGAYTSGFPVDMALERSLGFSDTWACTRLTGNGYVRTNLPNDMSGNSIVAWDSNEGWYQSTNTDTNEYSWMWKRAPNFFDVVAYTGNGTAGRTVSHNLGVAPEMMWVKKRDTNKDWGVYAIGLETPSLTASHYHLHINQDFSSAQTNMWHDTQPTSSEFYLGTDTIVNESAATYIAYLFATLPGVSKVGSYTGNGTSQTIDCGFTSGARFILVKRKDSAGNWYIWDTERGIVAGNDPYLELNLSNPDVENTDFVDPDSSGFIVNGTTINASGGDYIFYAIA